MYRARCESLYLRPICWVQLKTKRRAFDHVRAPILKAKTWVVRARWYLSTADDHRAKRQGYKLLPEFHYIPVSTIIQEHGVAFAHAGREGTTAESTLGEAEHDRLMSHNFATYT